MMEKNLLSGGVCAGHDGRSSRPRKKKQKVRRTKLQRMERFSPRMVDRIACRDRGFNPYRKRVARCVSSLRSFSSSSSYPGDELALYKDGITEACNERGEKFAEECPLESPSSTS